MKIDVLGIAQDGGCPHAGCWCDNCMAVYNNINMEKYPACLGITVDDFRLLVEATPKMDIQLEKWRKLQSHKKYLPDATVITHAHIGHYTGLMYLGKEVLDAKKHPVYCSEKMGQFLKTNAPYSDLFANNNIEIKTLTIDQEVQVNDSLSIKAVEIVHRNEHADTMALIISSKNKKILFLPDIDSWQGFLPTLNKILAKVDRAYLDASFYNHSELGSIRGRDLAKVPHPTVEETLRLIESGEINNKSCDIYLLHFNHSNRLIHSKYNKLAKGVYLAKQDI